jgi:ATP-dependent RNA helicase DHX37/DHR1
MDSFHLQSSGTLGTGHVSTAKERLERKEHLDVSKAMKGLAGSRRRGAIDIPDASEEDVIDAEEFAGGNSISRVQYPSSSSLPGIGTRANPVIVTDAPLAAVPAKSNVPFSEIAVGSALKRNSDGSVVQPIVVQRKIKGKKVSALDKFILSRIVNLVTGNVCKLER